MNRGRRRARSVFISYSRGGGQAHAVGLYQSLVQVLGEKAVFLDVGHDAMEAGRSWKESVREALARCDTLLLVLDPGMAGRLAEPDNAVLFELETALENGATIACVRVDGAQVLAPSDLPASFSGISDWHSPEVHSDAVVSDIERVTKDLTGRLPGQAPAVDRWDLAVAGITAVLAAAAWLSVGRELLNLHERWLWGAAFVAPWLLWMMVRRAVPIGNRGRRSLSYRQAGSWLVVLLVFGAGWLFARKEIYGLPNFEAESGILVSRLEGDPSDRYQVELTERLDAGEQVDSATKSLGRVAVLPARIGFSMNPWSGAEDGHHRAQRFGRMTQAAVVLWGKVLAPVETARRLAVNLTFIERAALFSTRGSKVVGALDDYDLSGLDANLETLLGTLPTFLKGYQRYQAAESDWELGLAEVEFTDAIEDLEGDLDEGDTDREALDEILASLHFYRGNTLLALERYGEAETEYALAVGQTADRVGGVQYPRYIEAASNLGFLLRKKCQHDQAAALLTAVDRECTGSDRPKRACAYAWYNLGDTLIDQGQLKRASAYFERAIERIEETSAEIPEDVEGARFEAYCHQNLSFSLVRRAAASEADEKDRLIEESSAARQRATDTLTDAGLEVPKYFRIAEGRIHIERGEWQEAIDVLESFAVPPRDRRNVHALLAGAYSCATDAADLEKVEHHLKALAEPHATDPQCGGGGISILEGMKEFTRIARLCA